MTGKTENNGPRRDLADTSPTWVREALEPDQMASARQPLGRQVLSRRTVILLWGLRFYVVLMVILVAVQTWNVFHAGK